MRLRGCGGEVCQAWLAAAGWICRPIFSPCSIPSHIGRRCVRNGPSRNVKPDNKLSRSKSIPVKEPKTYQDQRSKCCKSYIKLTVYMRVPRSRESQFRQQKQYSCACFHTHSLHFRRISAHHQPSKRQQALSRALSWRSRRRSLPHGNIRQRLLWHQRQRRRTNGIAPRAYRGIRPERVLPHDEGCRTLSIPSRPDYSTAWANVLGHAASGTSMLKLP